MDALIWDTALKLLDYGSRGITALVIVLWYLERKAVLVRFESLFHESAKADKAVATALAQNTVVTQMLAMQHGVDQQALVEATAEVVNDVSGE
jgi:hypothetical protein